ncbi:MAG TPA: type II secretion system F family protein [Candidatus Binataceae bacterium]|nr:type II secretion system F family protein [Candidatus Binataceae bacterium]
MPGAALSLAIAVFVLATASLFGLFAALSGDSRVRADRLHQPFAGRLDQASELGHKRIELEGFSRRLVEWQMRRANERKGDRQHSLKLRQLLGYAGHTGAEPLAVFRTIRLVAATLTAVVGAALAVTTQHSILLCVLAGVVLGYLVPDFALRRAARRRQRKISRELPAALDLLTVCLEAGLALNESLKMTARETAREGYAVGHELNVTYAELNAGVSLEDALKNLGERTGLDDAKAVAALLIQSDKMGTRLGPALRSSAEMLATRRRMQAEEQAQKSAIKMLIPLVLLILPAMIMVILGPAIIQLITVIGG